MNPIQSSPTFTELYVVELGSRAQTTHSLMDFLVLRAKRINPQEMAHRIFHQKPVASTSGASTSAVSTGAVPEQAKKAKTSSVRCRAQYYLHRCPQFRALTLRAKLETVNEAKLCHNCFAS